MNIRRRYFSLSRLQRMFLLLCLVFFTWGVFGTLSYFYSEKTFPIPNKGGVYREGVVGDPYSLVMNPVYVFGQKDRGVDSDVVSLLFAGLMKFDAEDGKMIDHFATHVLSPDKRTYTFRLKDGLKWHDGAAITAEDVMFTFQKIIQDPAFSNEILKAAFKDVKITKLSEMEVSFEIPYPYKFFITNFTVGLLPKHILESVPVDQLEYSDFSQHPLGNGSFKFERIEEIKKNVYTVSFSPFRDSSAFDPHLDGIELILYSSRNALFLDTESLSAIRPFVSDSVDKFEIDNSFHSEKFSLPQYSALFFNMKSFVFQGDSGRALRLALLSSTNKDGLLEIVKGVRIDSPILENLKNDTWFSFSLEKSSEFLNTSGYFFPGAKPKTFLPDKSDSLFIQKPSSSSESEFAKTKDLKSLEIAGEYPLKVAKTRIFVDSVQKDEKEKPEMDRQFSFSILFDDSFKIGTHEVRLVFLGFDGTVVGEDAISLYLYDPTGEEKEESKKYAIRENKEGKPLTLRLLTADSPEYYSRVAQYIKEDWAKVGVNIEIKVLPISDFLGTVAQRDYDILLYGQNLGYNLDIFEFFHESQVGKGNLSEYTNPKASVLIQEMRSTHVEDVRTQKLQELKEVLKIDPPAIFLFSPSYSYYLDSNIEGMGVRFIALLKDRFAHIDTVFVQKERKFGEAEGWWSYPSWLMQKIVLFITFSL